MKDWTIKKRIAFGFGIVLGLLVIVAGVSVSVLGKTQTTSRNIADNDVPGLAFGARTDSLEQEQLTLLFHHIASDDSARLDAIEKRMQEIEGTLDGLVADYEKTELDETDKRLLSDFRAARSAFTKARTDALDLSRQHKDADALALYEKSIAPLADALLKATDAIYERNEKAAVESSTDGGRLAVTALYGVVTLSAIAIALGALIAMSIALSLNRTLAAMAETLDAGSNEIAAAATQVSSSSQSLAEGASEQAASLEETSASLEEIGSMTKRNSESAQSAQSLSSQTRSAAEEGAARTEEMQEAMTAIQAASTRTPTRWRSTRKASPPSPTPC